MCEKIKTPEQIMLEYGYIQFSYGLHAGLIGGVLGTLLCMFASGKLFP